MFVHQSAISNRIRVSVNYIHASTSCYSPNKGDNNVAIVKRHCAFLNR